MRRELIDYDPDELNPAVLAKFAREWRDEQVVIEPMRDDECDE